MKVDVKEDAEEPCEEVIVDRETLAVMKVFSSLVDIPAIRLGLVSLKSDSEDLIGSPNDKGQDWKSDLQAAKVALSKLA